MSNPFSTRTPCFDADAINKTIERALESAGLDASSGPMLAMTETIRQALAAARTGRGPTSFGSGVVVDPGSGVVPEFKDEGVLSDPKPLICDVQQRPGRFDERTFRNDAGARTYKVYVPPGNSDTPRAMMVMLHGCTQSADDFAAGTQMNRLADEHDFLVVYPQQAARSNRSKCWNWFNPQDQLRGAGEPSLIAGIVRDVAQVHGADPSRIFVAGLSAGAAMAVVLGETYPELFAGVGAHSGLPYSSAHDVPSAFAAMKGERGGMSGAIPAPGTAHTSRRKAVQAVPIIVFHGDRDPTVHQSNGAQIVQQAQEAHGDQAGEVTLQVSAHVGVASGGRRFSRTVHADTEGRARIESWIIHGAGHAWSGGHASGSFTDSTGPDASAEMVRFFLGLPPAGSA